MSAAEWILVLFVAWILFNVLVAIWVIWRGRNNEWEDDE